MDLEVGLFSKAATTQRLDMLLRTVSLQDMIAWVATTEALYFEEQEERPWLDVGPRGNKGQ